MKKEEIEKRRKARLKVRDCGQQVSLIMPDGYKHPREIIDSMRRGTATTGTLHEHKPLPPDGENDDDFDTGTEEYLDIVDGMEAAERYNAKIAELEKQQAELQAKQHQQQIDDEVAKQLAARLSKERSDIEPAQQV